MSYYIYENWQAHAPERILRIHEGNCGFCQNGNGMREDANRGLNGVWIGPFDELDSAQNYCTNRTNDAVITIHNCINN